MRRPWLLVSGLVWFLCGAGAALCHAPKPHGADLPHATAAAPAPPAAATPRLNVQIEPPGMSIDAGRRADFLLVAHRSGTDAIEAEPIKLLVPDGVTARAEPDQAQSGAGDLVWRIHLEAAGSAPSAFSLVAVVSYAAKGGPRATDTAVANVTLTVPPDLASTVKTVLVPGDGTLDEFNPLSLNLAIQDTDRRSARIDGVTILSPPYAMLASPVAAATVAHGASATMALHIKTARRVVPGSYTLVVGYHVQPLRGSGAVEPATVTGKITIGVPGVSDVMALLGVSSFLLLPGALTVIAFVAVFARFTGSKELEWKSPTLLMIAVILSVCYAAGYPVLVRALFSQSAPNYLHGYDETDALLIWIGSAGAGALCGAAAGLAAPRLARWQKRWEPAETDQPIDILRKLAHWRADFSLPRWRKPLDANGNQDPTAFLPLPFGKAEPGHRWVVRQANANAPNEQDRNAIRDLLEGHDTRALYRRVKAAGTRMTLTWPANAWPRIVADADYVPDPGQTDRLFNV